LNPSRIEILRVLGTKIFDLSWDNAAIVAMLPALHALFVA
jgi:hypothetical protein